ncbi:cytochrome P450 [Trametes coccinea BRFM310]|uniref:Cytochrome P450 n=1 Tax=Trametes coccinea (strain BRFM310) TaxID=1353009 RepID=A0A1Y2J5V3_TRAC3|nr:cytochrome P450 [Trametes coccinea BRFM310]
MLVALVIIAGFLGLGLWQYRKRTNPVLDSIPGPPATSWYEGHVQTQFGRDAWGFFRMLETEYGPVAKLKGPLGTNWLYTWDPAAIHSILASGQASFDAIEELVEGFHFFLGPGLNGVAGDTHKKQRKMLQPVFSTKHIRELTPVFYNVSHKLVAALSRNVDDGLREVNVMNWLDLASLELMGQATIGYSFDLLTEDAPPDPFAAAIKSYIPTFFTPDTVIYRQLILLSKKLGMLSVARWIVDHTPSPAIRRLRAVSRILHEKSAEVVREKKEALAMGNLGSRKDIISTLLKANTSEENKDRLPDDQLIAQISVFFLAATDTTSNTLARILHVLAEHPDVQTKLREEILAAGDGGDLTYEALQALPYLDAVVKETLRVYVPVPINHRQAYRDTTLPLSKPVLSTSGTPIGSIPIPKGTIVVMYLPACNRNPALWGADADAWRPERWLEPQARAPVAEEEKVPIPSPYARLMTFLGGGRACIGFQFAVLEIKVVLASLLANFAFAPSPGKPVFWNHSGIVYPSLGMDSPAPEMWLNVERYRSSR